MEGEKMRRRRRRESERERKEERGRREIMRRRKEDIERKGGRECKGVTEREIDRDRQTDIQIDRHKKKKEDE